MKNTLFRTFIKDNKLTYEEVAYISGFTRAGIWSIANGKRKAGYASAIILASIFDMTPDEIFMWDRIEKDNLANTLQEVKKRKIEVFKRKKLI